MQLASLRGFVTLRGRSAGVVWVHVSVPMGTIYFEDDNACIRIAQGVVERQSMWETLRFRSLPDMRNMLRNRNAHLRKFYEICLGVASFLIFISRS